MIDQEGFAALETLGRCRFAPHKRLRLFYLAVGRDHRAARRLIGRHVPARPGVYGMIGREGELLYIGKSRRLVSRLLGHFAAGGERAKSRRIVERTARLVWETWPDELSALLRELELIRRWRPQYNVRGLTRYPRATYIAVGRDRAPGTYLTTGKGPGEAAVFGPIRGGRRGAEWLRVLNDHFGLRDCSSRIPISFSDDRVFFAQQRTAACLRHALGTCLGPCAAGCTTRRYRKQVRAVRAFLSGNGGDELDRLEAQMRAAAAAEQYELAATLRDTWKTLGELSATLRRLRDAEDRYRFVYPLRRQGGGGTTWYLIDRGRVTAATPAPRTAGAARRCQRLIETVFGTEGGVPTDRDDMEVLLLVAGWFKQHPAELERTLDPEAAGAYCRTLIGRRLAG